MHNDYHDILDLTDKDPRWWDEHAVPRFCRFHPHHCANIYANQVVLLLINCQGCGHEFKVCMSQSTMDRYRIGQNEMWPELSESIEASAIHYGDPPNITCCAAGPTMNSIPVKVLEFWHRNFEEKDDKNKDGSYPATKENLRRLMDWVREPKWEIQVEPEWAR